jgi:adenylyltransferase/sulfurtransferase
MSLTPSQLERYARHIMLREVGGPGQQRLLLSHVVMIGAGALGGPAAMYLAAAGVGSLTIIDDDTVSLSNLQRQVLFATAEDGHHEIKLCEAILESSEKGAWVKV